MGSAVVRGGHPSGDEGGGHRDQHAGADLGFGCIVVSETDVLSNNNYVRTFNMV